MTRHRVRQPLVFRALPHLARTTRRATSGATSWVLAAALFGAALVAGCNDSGSAASGSSVSAAQATVLVQDFVKALEPVDATTTSDVQDRAFRRATELREKLSRSGREVGLAALKAYQANPTATLDQQWPLLEVAASNCPKDLEPLLVQLITTYDGERGMGLATQAVRILGESSPQAAIELFEPILRTPWEKKTKPPQEAFVDGWARAAKKLGIKDAKVLCDVIVDIRQPADARYIAVNKVAEIGGERAEAALKEVFLEDTSDGHLRRKAAQALALVAPRKEFCDLMQHAAEHDSDEAFLSFLGSMLDKYCAGQ